MDQVNNFVESMEWETLQPELKCETKLVHSMWPVPTASPNNSVENMEWETQQPESGCWETKIVHSTPFSIRPIPTASPKLSPIKKKIQVEISHLAVRLADLKLN